MRFLGLAGSPRTSPVSSVSAASRSPRFKVSTALIAASCLSAIEPGRYAARAGRRLGSGDAEGVAVEDAAPALLLRRIHGAGRLLRVVRDLERAILEDDVFGRRRVAILPLDALDRHQLEVELQIDVARLLGAGAAGAADHQDHLLIVAAGAAGVEEVGRCLVDVLRHAEHVEIDLAGPGAAGAAADIELVRSAEGPVLDLER